MQKIAIILAGLCLTLLLSAPTNAQQTPSQKYGLETAGKKAELPYVGEPGETSVPQVVGKVINAGLTLIGIVFFIHLLYAGFLWMTARGDKERVSQSKDIITTDIIGLIIILAAYAITNFVFTELFAKLSEASVPPAP